MKSSRAKTPQSYVHLLSSSRNFQEDHDDTTVSATVARMTAVYERCLSGAATGNAAESGAATGNAAEDGAGGDSLAARMRRAYQKALGITR